MDIHRLSRLRHRNDPSVQRESNWSDAGDSLPDGLGIQWLGTAGFALGYQGTTVLIDPYVSRKDLATTLLAPSLTSDSDLVDQVITKADGVLVGHTHFDHAVDVATIARRHNCPVYGSSSLRHLMELHSLGDQAVVVDPHRRYEIGPFTVSFTPSVHSKLLLGLKVPSEGELTCDSMDHLGSARYRCGQVFGITIEVAGLVIYHQGSANLIERESEPVTWTSSCAGSRAGCTPATSSAGRCGPCDRGSWWPTTTTTSSARSGIRWASLSTSTSVASSRRWRSSTPTSPFARWSHYRSSAEAPTAPLASGSPSGPEMADSMDGARSTSTPRRDRRPA
ncbi:MAG: MBL fold metallo-hydrolase [Microthrixaceae bacterium]|nr:MBL fold metallo-hydrolase [Microthrixaceae bacterium]